MDLKISFEPISPKAPDLFIAVENGSLEDARAIAKTTAAGNSPASLMFAIHDAYGAVLECWDHADGIWRLSRKDLDAR